MLRLLKIRPKFGLFSGGKYPKFLTLNRKNLTFSLEDKKLNDHTRLLQLRVKNNGKKNIKVNSLLLAEFEISDVSLDKFLENGWGQSSFSGYVDLIKPTKRKILFQKRDQNPFSFKKDFGYLEKSIVNEWYTQIISANQAVVIGAVTTKDQFSQIFVSCKENKLTIRITCQVDGLQLATNREISSEKIVIVSGGIKESLDEFGNLVKQFSKVKSISLPPKGLRCAYYQQGNKVNEQYILDQLIALDKFLDKLSFEYIQIDAGYSPWGDWLDTWQQFPSGMKFIVKEIKKRGLKAGVWIAPFVASPRSKLFKDHNSWFLKDTNSKDFEARFTTPFDFLPFFSFRVLDVTQTEVQYYLTRVVKQFVHWGFDLIKLDFTYPVCFNTNYYRPMTRAQALRKGFEIIRKAAGDEIHLLSGITQISPLVGVVDSVRVGLDTLNPFVSGIPLIDRLSNNWILKQNLRNCEARQFLNGKIWINDADCVVLRQNTGLSKSLIDRHIAFVQGYGGSKWIGDNLNILKNKQVSVIKSLLR